MYVCVCVFFHVFVFLHVTWAIGVVQEQELKFTLRLDNCFLRDVDGGFMSKKKTFAIFNPDLRYGMPAYNFFSNVQCEIVLDS